MFCYFVDVFSGTHYSRKSRWSIRRGHNRLFTLKEKRKKKIRFLLHSPSRSAASSDAPALPSAARRRRRPRPPPARHRCPRPPAHAADLGALLAARCRCSPPSPCRPRCGVPPPPLSTQPRWRSSGRRSAPSISESFFRFLLLIARKQLAKQEAGDGFFLLSFLADSNRRWLGSRSCSDAPGSGVRPFPRIRRAGAHQRGRRCRTRAPARAVAAASNARTREGRSTRCGGRGRSEGGLQRRRELARRLAAVEAPREAVSGSGRGEKGNGEKERRELRTVLPLFGNTPSGYSTRLN